MTVEDGKPVEPHRGRWMYRILIASLALNLLVAGVAARAWHMHHGRFGPEFALMGFVRTLPQDRREIVRADAEAASEAIKPLRKAVREAWIEANATLAHEPFDKAAFLAASTRLLEAENRFKMAMAEAIAALSEKLTADERKKFQAWREAHKPPMLRRRGGPDGEQ